MSLFTTLKRWWDRNNKRQSLTRQGHVPWWVERNEMSPIRKFNPLTKGHK